MPSLERDSARTQFRIRPRAQGPSCSGSWSPNSPPPSGGILPGAARPKAWGKRKDAGPSGRQAISKRSAFPKGKAAVAPGNPGRGAGD